MRKSIEKINERINNIKRILSDLVEYNAADEIENECNRIIDILIEELWNELEDVLFIEKDNGTLILASAWNEFDAGTDRETIWHWFDEHHNKGIHWLLYGTE